ncbi:MAG: LON peptidase substrate-binding domain-containing protein [Planctomycetes bacterium]|nr:LON peptidase substrate-binding domain-containing protein [Planctomycetota bacterium]
MTTALPQAPVPMFPLPAAFLFPHQALPLHVFEPRYRALVGDLLDGPGRFVLGTILPQAEAAPEAPPHVLPVAGLGEILRHEKLADGRYLIWVLGLCRVRIEEVASAKPYRLVRCHPFVEQDVPADASEGLAVELRAATTARLRHPLPLPEHAPPSLLCDLLLQTLSAPPEVLAHAFGEPSIEQRARYVLGEAERTPPPA